MTTQEFINRWSTWWLFLSSRKRLDDAFEKELNQLIEAERLSVKPTPIKITLHEYSHHCADGCCHRFGTITKVNGVELPSHNQDLKTILTQLCEHLGYKVEIECTYDID